MAGSRIGKCSIPTHQQLDGMPPTCTFRDVVDGQPLVHPSGKRPFLRVLWLHARISFRRACGAGWIEEGGDLCDAIQAMLDMSQRAGVAEEDIDRLLAGHE